MARLLSMLASIAACALFLASAGDLAAQEKDAKTYIEEAQAAFEAGKFDDADAAISAGLTKEPKNHGLLRLRGEIRLARRDFEGALAAYEAYLAAKPRGANRRKARKIIANLAASRSTALEVKVPQGPANVYLDSKSIGVYCVANPVCKKGMLPGRYRVFVERDGFLPAQKDVRLRLGKTEVVSLELVEKKSALTITVVPNDAIVTVNGQPRPAGEGPLQVAAGNHVIEATLDGFVTGKETIAAALGKPVTISLALAEKVPVATSVEGATITLDGQPVELLDGAVAVPSDGNSHTLVATADGFRDASVTIAADRKRGQPVTLTLEKIPDIVTPPPTSPEAGEGRWSKNRTYLFSGLVGVAAVGLITGSVVGLAANSSWSDAENECEGDRCSPRGLELVDDAKGRANLANVAFSVGIAAAIGAGVVWFTAPSASPESPAVSAMVTPDNVGVTVRMGF